MSESASHVPSPADVVDSISRSIYRADNAHTGNASDMVKQTRLALERAEAFAREGDDDFRRRADEWWTQEQARRQEEMGLLREILGGDMKPVLCE